MANILICTDSFRDYKSSTEIGAFIQKAIIKSLPIHKVKMIPLADGGEGTLAAISYYLKLDILQEEVLDPLKREISAGYLYDAKQKLAYVCMAEASGLELLDKAERNCYYTTTYGTGQLIAAAVRKGAQELALFVGGSATCDMGFGMLAALGATFTSGLDMIGIPVGMHLREIDAIQLPKKTMPRVTVYTDVLNPLFGPQGAAYIYAPQKGADETQVDLLDEGLQHMHGLIVRTLDIDVNQAGSGAAGGIGAGALLGLGATLKPSTDFLFDIAGLKPALQDADIIITGEGKLDEQTLNGKLIQRVADAAKDKRLIVICGRNTLTKAQYQSLGIELVIALSDLGDPQHQQDGIADNLRLATKSLIEYLAG